MMYVMVCMSSHRWSIAKYLGVKFLSAHRYEGDMITVNQPLGRMSVKASSVTLYHDAI